MNLYLMRHCKPFPGLPADDSRELTPEGLKCAADMGKWLAGHIGRVDIVISSPFKRAVQTARLMGEAMGAHVETTTALVPSGKASDAYEEIVRLMGDSKDILVVGHDPCLNGLICWLQGNDLVDASPINVIRLDWGAVAFMAVKGNEPGGYGKLQWLVTPAIVLADAEVVEAARDLAESLEL